MVYILGFILSFSSNYTCVSTTNLGTCSLGVYVTPSTHVSIQHASVPEVTAPTDPWFLVPGLCLPVTTGMFHVHRPKRLKVIAVNDIERGVHLIPKYGREIGETTKMRRIIEERRTIITLEETNRAGAWRASKYRSW
jgi:hypothetical protein